MSEEIEYDGEGANRNPYWDMLYAVSMVGPYFTSVQDMLDRYPDREMRSLYKLEYRLDAPEQGDDDDTLGIWTIGLGPMMQAYMNGRCETRGLNPDVEMIRCQEAIREHMMRFMVMQQVAAGSPNVIMVEMPNEDGE